MTPERWRQLTAIFHDAQAREAAERAAYLDRACAGDPSLRAEVESLLAAPGTLDAGGDRTGALPQLPVGTMLGQYCVDGLVGAGGMGQVYRATDTRLHRTVALKLLLPDLSLDPGFGARFEREARVLASLNHPNIAAIHGFEDGNGVPALVLEFVEGPTLADRLLAGPLATAEALSIARQIALALEAAHEKGIVHRDLKPSNVKVTPAGIVKVLDFGIARVATEEARFAETAASTRAGAIIGTAAYMSPEQARGLVVDKRTDIWAFGCVLFEMLTGRGAFAADTASDSLAKVIEREPEWSALPASAPASILRLVKRCLQKDPANRLRDIADARIEIDEALARPGAVEAASARPRSSGPLIMTALVAAALALVAAAIWWRPRQPPPVETAAGQAMEFPIVFPNNAMPADGIAISPDGRKIVANVWINSGTLWIAPLDGSPPKPLNGGEPGSAPFWSPDSSTIGFFRGRLSDAAELVTISANGGPVTRVASLSSGSGAAGSWNAKGVIVFSLSGKIFRVPATGGDPVELPLSGVKGSPQSPAFLSDGQHFIFCAENQISGSIYVASLDDGKAIELGESDCPGGVAPVDYVLFLRRGELVASKLDLSRLALAGDTRVVATGVTRGALGPWPQLTPSASTTGVLAIPALRGGSPLGQLTWFDRNGKITGAIALPSEPGAEYLNPVISPVNEKLVAANRMDPQTGAWHVWVIDGARGNAASRLTTDLSSDRDPVWSRDGKEIIYASDRGGEWAFYRQAYAGGAAVRLPVDLAGAIQPIPSDWAAGDRLLFSQLQRSTWTVLLADRLPTALGDFGYGPHLSPDGRWLAYAAAPDRHRFEVFVERFPSGSPRRQITTDGGAHPRWTRTARGTELVYWSVTEGIESVPLSLSDQAIQIGETQVLVPQVLGLIDARTAYDITPDGQKILARELAKSATGGIRVIVNWTAKLK